MKIFIVCAMVLQLLACTVNDRTELKKFDEKITVYIDKGSRQCFTGSGMTIETTRSLLSEGGVAVIKSECGGWKNRIYPTVCGGKTGAINIHHISASDFDEAKKLGFNELKPEDQYSVRSCENKKTKFKKPQKK